MTFLTDFGNSAVLLPVSLYIFGLLLRYRARAALWWGVAFSLCVGGIGLLKAWYAACPLDSDLHNPSGHTGFSTLVYGALFIFAAFRTRGWTRAAIYAGGISWVLAIALSRVALGAHTPHEVVTGLAIGSAALAIFVWGARSSLERMTIKPYLLGGALIIILLHGRELNAEPMLGAVGFYLKFGNSCP